MSRFVESCNILSLRISDYISDAMITRKALVASRSGISAGKKSVILLMLSSVVVNAQSISISNFYYRDFLDFGQNRGIFSNDGSLLLTGKDGEEIIIPQSPNFQASSNYGSLTSVGRGFGVTANHVTNVENAENTLNFGLTKYVLASQSVGSGDVKGVSKPYGRDTKFIRLTKYVVEGQVGMLDVENSINKNSSDDTKNLEAFKQKIEELKDTNGKIYIYQAGSGTMKLRDYGSLTGDIFLPSDGSMKGGGFGEMSVIGYYELVPGYAAGDSKGITMYYYPNGDFNNRITTGDSGSGIYAYDSKNQKWILLGVTSRATEGQNRAEISAVSQKDLEDYRKNFEQKIELNNNNTNWTLEKPVGANLMLKNGTEKQLESNKDIIFSGGGTVEVKSDIDRSQSSYAGGFVFEAGTSSQSPTKYVFKNGNATTSSDSNKTHFFKGSGLDIGENVEVEWHLRNQSGDALHKVGKGTLIVKTDYTPTNTSTQSDKDKSENLGYLKIGEGKVVLDTNKKAYEGIYITSGRGSLELKSNKAEALGAIKNESKDISENTQSENANAQYTLSQDKNNNMGFYFGTGGGTLDLGGNSLKLNTIAANDSKAIITNSSTSEKSTLEIEGFGYDSNGSKESTKADTIIHASIGTVDTKSTEQSDAKDSTKDSTQTAESNKDSTNKANIDIVYNGSSSQTADISTQTAESTKATLVFDGNINTSGKMDVKNGNVALQGHATAHAIVSDETIREQIKNAEDKTQKGMPDYMDLTKPSSLNQPDWDNRSFTFGSGGISLENATLTLGRNASLESDIDAKNNSNIKFGSGVKHFIDNKDLANINSGGFGYYQKVESGDLDANNKALADETIGYKGKITSDGGNVESSILDFNASLDLKNKATLKADYLTLTNSDTVKVESGSNASVGTLRLNNVSDLNNITIGTSGTDNESNDETSKFEVKNGFWFDNSTFDLTKLDSKITKSENYDIIGVKSNITGTDKALSGNVSLFDSASLSVKSITLKTDSSTEAKSKDTIYLQGDSSQENHTKLTLSENLKVESLNKASIILDGKSEISTKSIEFDSIQDGLLYVDKDAKLSNGSDNAKVEVKGKDSSVNIAIGGEQSFNISGEGGSKITLQNITQNDSDSSATLKGDISLKDSSNIITSLENITAKVELDGSASLKANNITLQDTYNSINLKGTSSIVANEITAKNLTSLTLSAESGTNANITHFIFDGGTISSGLKTLFGDNITLKNNANITVGESTQDKTKEDKAKSVESSTNVIALSGRNIFLESTAETPAAESQDSKNAKTTLKATNLTFNGDKNSTITADKDSKLDIDSLSVDKANLTLYLADSKTNAEHLKNIDVKNGGKAIFTKSWDLHNATNFQSDETSRVIFGNVIFDAKNHTRSSTSATNANSAIKTIGANTTIEGNFSLLNVGSTTSQATTSQSQATQSSQSLQSDKDSNRFYAVNFDSKNLTLGEQSKINVSLDASVKKNDENLTLGTYYTLMSAGSVSDNRTDKRIDFSFDSSLGEADKLFVVSKFMDNKLLVKFLESDPKTYSELNKHIDSSYSKYLAVLIEHNNNDDSIDIAAKTDDYNVLAKRLQEIDTTMQSIAESNVEQSRLTSNLLMANNHTIDTRITQVRLSNAKPKKPLYFAYNDTMQRLLELQNGGVRSDVSPSFSSQVEERLNDVWLNVGGGYFGGDQSMGFATTNLGYDRLLKLDNGDVIVGGMLGFGVSKGSVEGKDGFSENAQFYNVGLYTHSIFGGKGGVFGGHELQGNFNVSIYNNARKFTQSQSATNLAAGILLNLYYKYNFVIASDEDSLHSLKPVALLAFGYNHSGAFMTQEYQQKAYSDAGFGIGLGIEYDFVKNDSFYSVQFLAQDRVFNTNKSVDISMSNAKSFIGYNLTSASKVDFSLNFTGSHYITSGFYIQYGIMGLLDTQVNYGIKGDIKIGYKF